MVLCTNDVKATSTDDVVWHNVYFKKLDSAKEGGGQVLGESHKHNLHISVNSHHLNLTE